MSHVDTNMDIFFTDLDLVEACLRERFPKLKLMREQKTWAWYGSWQNDHHGENAAYKHGIKPEDYGTCDHALHLEGCEYEIGLMPIEKDGVKGWVPVWDFWDCGRRLSECIGDAGQHLLTEYNRQTMMAACLQQGMTYQEELQQDGQILVTMTQYT